MQASISTWCTCPAHALYSHAVAPSLPCQALCVAAGQLQQLADPSAAGSGAGAEMPELSPGPASSHGIELGHAASVKKRRLRSIGQEASVKKHTSSRSPISLVQAA